MPEWYLAGLPEFGSRHGLSYNMRGRAADEKCLPKPVGVHPIFAHSWSKGWGQPQTSGLALRCLTFCAGARPKTSQVAIFSTASSALAAASSTA